MHPAQAAAQPIGVHHPLYRAGSSPLGWVVTQRSLASPAPDGSVAYYFDQLVRKPLPRDQDDDGPFNLPFDPNVGWALCEYLKALTASKGVGISDGPFVQLLDDDGCVPERYLMIRGIVWADEFDLLVPVGDEPLSRPIRPEVSE